MKTLVHEVCWNPYFMATSSIKSNKTEFSEQFKKNVHSYKKFKYSFNPLVIDSTAFFLNRVKVLLASD